MSDLKDVMEAFAVVLEIVVGFLVIFFWLKWKGKRKKQS